ncbi:hypothetical protein DVH05_013354 [Phytophthora capsici]|nr:hypothetical protein DVH05_013354 [Phytophthora capsici]
MRQGYHDSVKITGAAEKFSLNSSGEFSKTGKIGGKGGPSSNASPISSSNDDTESSCFQVAFTASMMLLGTVLVRDYSNKTLPESVRR